MKVHSQKKGGVALSYIQMVSNVLVKFLYTPFLLRELGQNEYGLFSLVMSIVGYLSILDMGFGSTVTRYTVKYKSENDKDNLYKLYGTLSVIYIIIGLIALAICLLLSYFSSSLFGANMNDGELYKLKLMLVLCGVNLLFSFPLQISASVIVAYEKFIFKNGLNLLRTFLQPAIMVLLLYLVHIKSVGSIVVVTSFNLLTYLAYFIYSGRKLGFRFSFGRFDSKMIKPLLTFSMSMFFLMIFEQLQYNSGQFILGLFQGTEVIAVWGIAMIFVLNYRSLSTAITNVYLPSFISMTIRKDEKGISDSITTMTRLQALVLCTILFNFILFGRDFIDIWAGDAYHDAYKCALIVLVPMTLALILDFCYLIQIASNKLIYRNITFFSGYILSFILIYKTLGIGLESYSYVMALSIITGQILGVLVFVKKKINLNMSRFFLNLAKLMLAPLAFSILCFMARMAFQDVGAHTIPVLIVEIALYNLFLFAILWFVSLSEKEKGLLKGFLK